MEKNNEKVFKTKQSLVTALSRSVSSAKWSVLHPCLVLLQLTDAKLLSPFVAFAGLLAPLDSYIKTKTCITETLLSVRWVKNCCITQLPNRPTDRPRQCNGKDFSLLFKQPLLYAFLLFFIFKLCLTIKGLFCGRAVYIFFFVINIFNQSLHKLFLIPFFSLLVSSFYFYDYAQCTIFFRTYFFFIYSRVVHLSTLFWERFTLTGISSSRVELNQIEVRDSADWFTPVKEHKHYAGDCINNVDTA